MRKASSSTTYCFVKKNMSLKIVINYLEHTELKYI